MKSSVALLVLSYLALGALSSGASHDKSTPNARFSGSTRRRFSGLATTDNKAAEALGVPVGAHSRRRRLKSGKSHKSKKSSKSSKKKSHKSHKSSKHKSSKRKCKTNEHDDSVQLMCSAHEGKIKDKIDFILTTGKTGAVVQVKYKLDDKSDANESGFHHKIKEEYEIYFSSLVEYLPVGSGGDFGESQGFGWSANETVGSIDLSEWKPFSKVTKDEDGVLQFHVETEDGIARFNFKMSEEGMEGRHLSANRIKIDVTLADFPWTRDDTLVALLSRVEANTKLETHYHTSKSRSHKKSGTKSKSKPRHPTDVVVTYDNASLPFGKFVWVTSADVGNGTASSEVVATSPPEHEIPPEHNSEGIQYIAFSFLNSSSADFIYWDPEAGIEYPDSDVEDEPQITQGMSLSESGASNVRGFYQPALMGLLFLGHVW